MAVVNKTDLPMALEIRGKLGRPNFLGKHKIGFSWIGDDDFLAGIYQKRPRTGGQIFVRMAHYWPTQNPSSEQEAARNFLAAAVLAWQGLDEETKLAYNRRKSPRGMSGYNRFISDFCRGLV